MDAATLYTIISVATGPKRTTTEKFPTMAVCEQVAEKLRKQAAIKDAIFYCVKRKPEPSERAAVRAAMRRRMPSVPQKPKGAGPIGMPRDFYSGTTPPQQ